MLLALAAAFVHAGWNLLTARADDSHVATGVSLAIGALVFAPAAAVMWEIDASVTPYAIASIALELCYFALLAAAYQRGPMSVVYPVARGAAPVLVAGFGAVALGVSLSAKQILGVLLVAGGIVLVRGLDRTSRRGDVALALATGCAIAGYTLVDKQALAHGVDPLAYLELVLAPTAAIYLAVTLRVADFAAVRRAAGGGAVVAGVGMFGAYALTLAALQRADAAPVAAVRESSIVIAAALAATFTHERVGPVRAGGAALVCAGVTLLALA